MADDDITLRDRLMIQALPAALDCALKGWGHICPTVIERAAEGAYEVADGVLKYRAEHADKGIPIHPTSLASTGINGVAYIPEEGDVLGGASYGVRTNQARSVERQMEEAERQRRRQAGEE